MDDGGLGNGGGGAPVVWDGGGVVGWVRQLEGRSGMESVELGGDCGDRGNGGGSLVSCSSGERRSSLGATAPAVPGRREDISEVRDEVAVWVE